MGEDVSKIGDLVEARNAVAGALMSLADETGQKHGLATGNRDRALDLSLCDGRRQAVGRCRRNIADFLLDIEPDVAIHIHPRRHPQDDPGVAVIDGVHNGVVGGQDGRAAGGDRYLIADLQCRDLVVDDDERGIGQNLDLGHGMQRIEDHAGLGFGSDQEIESGERPVEERIGG